MITGRQEPTQAVALSVGTFAFLSKPVDDEALLSPVLEGLGE
jgi:CheY-like chemotaxis protein